MIDERLKQIADHYVLDEPLNMLHEECAELIQAVSKYRRTGKLENLKVVDYFVDSDKVYKMVRKLPENALKYPDKVNDYIHDVCGQKEAMDCYELDYICDRVALSDDNRKNKANAWVSEMYCRNGRHDPINGFADTFYELNI